MLAARVFRVEWPLDGGGALRLLATLGDAPVAMKPQGTPIHFHGTAGAPWSVAWTIA
jgi:hypothetical protein